MYKISTYGHLKNADNLQYDLLYSLHQTEDPAGDVIKPCHCAGICI